MSYVVASYAIVGCALAAYGLHLIRERRALLRSLAGRGTSDRG